jgi:hypothetical protein
MRPRNQVRYFFLPIRAMLTISRIHHKNHSDLSYDVDPKGGDIQSIPANIWNSISKIKP